MRAGGHRATARLAGLEQPAVRRTPDGAWGTPLQQRGPAPSARSAARRLACRPRDSGRGPLWWSDCRPPKTSGALVRRERWPLLGSSRSSMMRVARFYPQPSTDQRTRAIQSLPAEIANAFPRCGFRDGLESMDDVELLDMPDQPAAPRGIPTTAVLSGRRLARCLLAGSVSDNLAIQDAIARCTPSGFERESRAPSMIGAGNGAQLDHNPHETDPSSRTVRGWDRVSRKTPTGANRRSSSSRVGLSRSSCTVRRTGLRHGRGVRPDRSESRDDAALPQHQRRMAATPVHRAEPGVDTQPRRQYPDPDHLVGVDRIG